MDQKIQAFANIGLIYARIMENKKQMDEVSKICEALLLTPLSHHTRKLVNTVKARISSTKGTKSDSKKTSSKEKDK